MRRPGAWAWAGAAVALAVALALFDLRIYTGGDNAVYYALARAIATGRGYVDLIAPGAPPESTFPPGFPLVLAPFYLVFGGAYAPLKLVSWLACGVALLGTWALLRRDPAVPAWAAAAAVWLVGLHPTFLAYAHWILSEPTFLAVSLLALWAFARAEEEGDADRWTGWWLAGLGLGVATFAVRTAGLALLVAAVLQPALRRRWRRAGAAAVAVLVAAVPWLVWTSLNPPPTGGYLDQLLASDPYDPTSPPVPLWTLVEWTGKSAVWYATRELPRLLWSGDPAPLVLRAIVPFLLGGLLVYGAVRAVRARGVRVHDLHVLLTLLLIFVWPWRGDRFLLVIVPLLWLYVLVGLDGLSRLATRRVEPAAAFAALVAVVLLLGAVRQVPASWAALRVRLDGGEMAGYDEFWTDYFGAARWIGETAPDAVIVSRKPSLAWYWSGRPAVVYPFRHDEEAIWSFIAETGATHVLLDGFPSTHDYLVPALEAREERLALVHSEPNRNAFVLRILPAGGAPAPEPAP